MNIIVKKFGGTSVSSASKIKNIAKKIVEESSQNRIVVVLSAMGKTTDQLVSLAQNVRKIQTRKIMIYSFRLVNKSVFHYYLWL